MEKQQGLLYKLGIPTILFWGYVGVFLFMLGAGIENSWLSSYLVNIGLTKTESATIFSLYGVLVALVSWLSGILVQIFGVRKVMISGLIIFILSSVPLILWAIPSAGFIPIAVTYMLRGMSYPLFVYSFLVWITYRASNEIMGRATSWFWICFNLGITIVGPTLAANSITFMGELNVLWLGMGIALLGGFCALILNRDQLILPKNNNSIAKELTDSLLIMFKKPKLGMGMLVKTVNSIAQYGFVIIMPIYLITKGFSLAQWASIWGLSYIVCTFASIFFGFLGDKFGWRKTVAYFAGTLTGLSCLLIYYAAEFMSGQYLPMLLSFIVYALGLAAYNPLSALMPALAPDNKAAAVSVLNLGSGLSNFVGPLIVSIMFEPFGAPAVLFTFAILYFASSIVAFFLKTPAEEANKSKAITEVESN
ncbi:MFS transporter [Enterococcus sp. HY326]|uniref:MFS transporter n=1 Tax=Enterococcus sp. HY326 TaxID=2971265 RepID=UPI00223F766A|nr:MFS transporter [Enterococcus sp. HY326]